jgi:2'-5' RNA ligase
MHAIISELDETASGVVKSFWERLRDACGLKAIYDLPTPHFTWFTAEAFDIPTVRTVIADLATTYRPLITHVFGLGLFSGSRPVFYLPVVKSQDMLDLHREIWEKVQPYCHVPNNYYSVEHWLPHITLALNDVTPINLACALEQIAFEPVEMIVSAVNLIVVAQADVPVNQTLYQYRFNG